MLLTLLCLELEEQEQVVGEEEAASNLARAGLWCARKGPPPPLGVQLEPHVGLLLWGHWGSSEELLGRAWHKAESSRAGSCCSHCGGGSRAPGDTQGLGCPAVMQGHAELPCAVMLIQVCRQGCASAVSLGSMRRGCQQHSCI